MQEVAQLLQHALRPVPALRELSEGAARGIKAGSAEAGGQRARNDARHAAILRVEGVGIVWVVARGYALLELELLLGEGRRGIGGLRGRANAVVELRQVHLCDHNILARHVEVDSQVLGDGRHRREAWYLRLDQHSSRRNAIDPSGGATVGAQAYFSVERAAIVAHGAGTSQQRYGLRQTEISKKKGGMAFTFAMRECTSLDHWSHT
ncbi:hypothetical protein PSPO01_15949 [Paraphaeosphaeria sporulosa]